MALPASYNTVEVRGRYVDTEGDPVVGSVTFTPTAPVITVQGELTTVISKPVKKDLIAGQFSVLLPATDDPDISPTGFAYEVRLTFRNAKERKLLISVPIALADTGFDLIDAEEITDGGLFVPGPRVLDGGTP